MNQPNTQTTKPESPSELADILRQVEELKGLFSQIRNDLDRLGLMRSGESKVPALSPRGLLKENSRLRSELAKAKRALESAGFVDNGGQEWKPPLGPTPHRFAGAAALATSYGASQEAKDDPPADVLGEAFRDAMTNAEFYRDVYLMGGSLRTAIKELALVVERIARAQKQEDR